MIELRRGGLAAQESEQRVKEAQVHLLDAIEAIPAAVGLYDGDDRLMQVNTRFREAFSPRGSHPVELGVTFEEVLRRFAAQGHGMAVDGSSDDWLARRLAVRRAGKESCELHLSDGRWFRSYERRGRSGILVAVAVDVFDLTNLLWIHLTVWGPFRLRGCVGDIPRGLVRSTRRRSRGSRRCSGPRSRASTRGSAFSTRADGS